MNLRQKIRLLLRSGPLKGADIELEPGKTSIGRDLGCGLRLDDPKVSRFHAELELADGSLVFRDNGSTNGSLVNGKRVTAKTVSIGDVLQVGTTEIAIEEALDIHTVQFVDCDSSVTVSVQADADSAEALARKFSSLFETEDESPYRAAYARPDADQARRLAKGLRSLFLVTQRMGRLAPEEEVLEVVAEGVFTVFEKAENLIILLEVPGKEQFEPVLRRSRGRQQLIPGLDISRTIVRKAVEEKATLAASDVNRDLSLHPSESIVGLSLKSVLCAPLLSKDSVLGCLYLDNRQNQAEYDEIDAELVTIFANQAAGAIDNARLVDDLQESYVQMLQSLVRAIEAKDPYTSGHTQRVKGYAQAIAREMRFDEEHVARLGIAADLHDIGKIGIREGIINKTGALSETEYTSIKEHVELGEQILRPLSHFADILPWIRGHHERWDGKGYPDGLKGERCPLEARILAAADAYDAMTSKRTYNDVLPPDQAIKRLRDGAGTHFDPSVVNAFERCLCRDSAGTMQSGDDSPPGDAILPDPSTQP